MRKIVSSFFLSLDGVMESPETWHSPYLDDRMGAAIGGAMAQADALLLGRVTYQEWAAYWPHQSAHDNQFTDFMNATPKYVVSTTLDAVEWQNSTLVTGDVVEEITGLKQRAGGNIAISGCATLVRSLLREDLIDELHLMIHPVVVGRGRRLFADRDGHKDLKLIRSEIFDTGVAYLVYEPTQTVATEER